MDVREKCANILAKTSEINSLSWITCVGKKRKKKKTKRDKKSPPIPGVEQATQRT